MLTFLFSVFSPYDSTILYFWRTVDGFKSVPPLLQAFGRDLQKKIKVESWEELFNLNGSKLKAMDVTVKDRRYVI